MNEKQSAAAFIGASIGVFGGVAVAGNLYRMTSLQMMELGLTMFGVGSWALLLIVAVSWLAGATRRPD
jgi:hypothetical protein